MTVILRGGLEVVDPLGVALAFVAAYAGYEPRDASGPASFAEPDLRQANRGGARISAAEIAAVLERRGEIEAALAEIAPGASLASRSVPWAPLTRLFAAFGEIRGVGLAKATKALHPKRPALVPMLDSFVQAYLAEDDDAAAPFGERATRLVRGYKRDLDANRSALRELRRELARRGYALSEVRILDMLIWSAGAASPRVSG